jgi:hypothetical protein
MSLYGLGSKVVDRATQRNETIGDIIVNTTDSARRRPSASTTPREFDQPGSSLGAVELTLTIWPELDDMLDNMADELGVTKGEAIVKALGLLRIALDAKRDGRKLVVVDDRTGEEEEVTGI